MRLLQIEPLRAADPEIGRWLWAFEETRKRTLKLAQGLEQRVLDWEGPDGSENSIGTLLCHLSAVEIDWLYVDLLGRKIPEEVMKLLPFADDRDASGRLVRVLGESFAQHEARLAATRKIFLAEFQDMPLERWRKLCKPMEGDAYECTPEWVVFHLIEHEAGHAYQIAALKRRAGEHFGGSK
jgi:uncharacterized damage-inducible protein DinB